MTQHDKQMLCSYLLGTTTPLHQALTRLDIDESDKIAAVEISDTTERCKVCQKWTDVDVVDNGLCPRCDERLNPENRTKSET